MTSLELKQSLERALAKFVESKDFPDSEPMRESAIQRFEYTFELSWKLMSSLLKDQSIEVYGVKNTIREAAKLGVIESVERWFMFALARNKAAHIYKEEVAREVYDTAMSGFDVLVKDLLLKSKDYLG